MGTIDLYDNIKSNPQALMGLNEVYSEEVVRLKCTDTVPTYNSCSELAGCQGIVHNRMSDCNSFFGMAACVTSRLNGALFQKICVSFMCFAYF